MSGNRYDETIGLIDAIVTDLSQEGNVSPLSVAMELLESESKSFLLVMRLGDRDHHEPNTARQFAVVGRHETAAADYDPRLIETVREWLAERDKARS